ncbi:MAG: hypothetical protein JJU11_06705 [Candidatus Sumerlaeia bacterium]|nr:hypothetical protein [Candidatus Sumerlaeia bacterium]
MTDTTQPPPAPKSRTLSGKGVIVAIPILAVVVFALGLALMGRYTEMKTHQGVARAAGDLRALAVAIEAYEADHGTFPAMAKSREWAAGAYVLPREVPVSRTFRMRNQSDLATLTTPVAYITHYPADPFREFMGTTYSYFTDGRGWILGSWGPNMNQSLGGDLQWQRGPLHPEYAPEIGDQEGGLDTGVSHGGQDGRTPLPGQGVATVYVGSMTEPSDWLLAGNHDQYGVGAFTYDPTNGTFSGGDIWRIRSSESP